MSRIRGVRLGRPPFETFILNYGFEPYRVHLLCPECGSWNLINESQERGGTSVVCDNVKRGTCTFHETHDWTSGSLLGPPEGFNSDLAQAATRWIGVRLRKGEWPSDLKAGQTP